MSLSASWMKNLQNIKKEYWWDLFHSFLSCNYLCTGKCISCQYIHWDSWNYGGKDYWSMDSDRIEKCLLATILDQKLYTSEAQRIKPFLISLSSRCWVWSKVLSWQSLKPVSFGGPMFTDKQLLSMRHSYLQSRVMSSFPIGKKISLNT